MAKKIELIALDAELFELYQNDGFETVKEARQWVKDVLLNKAWWNRLAENKTFALTVFKIELHVDGVIRSDWFPEFKA